MMMSSSCIPHYMPDIVDYWIHSNSLHISHMCWHLYNMHSFGCRAHIYLAMPHRKPYKQNKWKHQNKYSNWKDKRSICSRQQNTHPSILYKCSHPHTYHTYTHSACTTWYSDLNNKWNCNPHTHSWSKKHNCFESKIYPECTPLWMHLKCSWPDSQYKLSGSHRYCMFPHSKLYLAHKMSMYEGWCRQDNLACKTHNCQYPLRASKQQNRPC